MAARRYYYSDSISDFLSRSNNEIVGTLTLASQHDVNDETSKSWVEEIETRREVLDPYEEGRRDRFLFRIRLLDKSSGRVERKQ